MDTLDALDLVSSEIEIALFELRQVRHRNRLSKRKDTVKHRLRKEKRQAVLKAERRHKPVAA